MARLCGSRQDAHQIFVPMRPAHPRVDARPRVVTQEIVTPSSTRAPLAQAILGSTTNRNGDADGVRGY